MKIDIWLTEPANMADWARGDYRYASFVLEGHYDHMTSSGWVKVGSVEFDPTQYPLPADAKAKAAEALAASLEKARANFEAKCTEIRAQINSLLAIEG